MVLTKSLLDEIFDFIDSFPDDFTLSDKFCSALIINSENFRITANSTLSESFSDWTGRVIDPSRIINWAKQWNSKIFANKSLKSSEIILLHAHANCLKWIGKKIWNNKFNQELIELSQTTDNIIKSRNIYVPDDVQDLILFFNGIEVPTYIRTPQELNDLSTYHLTHLMLIQTDYLSCSVRDENLLFCENVMTILHQRLIKSGESLELDKVFEILILSQWFYKEKNSTKIRKLLLECMQSFKINEKFIETLLNLSKKYNDRLCCHRLLTLLPLLIPFEGSNTYQPS